MALQSQYVIRLHRDENPTKSRCATISCAHWVKIVLINMVTTLMMLAKMATLGLFNIKAF